MELFDIIILAITNFCAVWYRRKKGTKAELWRHRKSRPAFFDLGFRWVKVPLCVGPIAILAASTVNLSSQDAQVFKEFLATRPNIEELVFEKDLVAAPLPQAAKKQMFLARWQPSGYYVQVLQSPRNIDEISVDLISGGRLGDVKWNLHGGQLFLLDPMINTLTTNLPVYRVEATHNRTLMMAANLGILEIEDGRPPRWSYNRLEIPTDGGMLYGNAIIRNGLITRLDLGTERNGQVSVSLEYEYNDEFKDGRFPQKAIRYNVRGQNRIKWTEITYLRLKTSQEPLRSGILDPHRLIEPDKQNVFYYSNNVLYAKSMFPSASPLRVLSKEEAARLAVPNATRSKAKLALFMLILGLVSFGGILALRIRQNVSTQFIKGLESPRSNPL